MSKKKPSVNIIIRRNDSVGTGDAETDHEFQESAFIDNGLLEILRDTRDPKRILLGRTGSGKTLLATKLKSSEENVIEIDPSSLAMQYVSSSNIIKFVEELGVPLDNFFLFLWLHVISVELIRKRYKIFDKHSKRNFFERMIDRLSESKRNAINYVENYGDKFWEDTVERVKEFTDRIESEFSTELNVGQTGIASFQAGDTNKLTSEQKVELAHRAQNVVSKVQLKKLGELIAILSEDIFNDKMQSYYIIIDGLDDDWAEDLIRYRLIKSLLDAVRKMISVRNVKVIVCLRTDILYKILEKTKTTGAQEEKYESLFMELRWSTLQLKALLESRVKLLFRKKYTNSHVNLSDILPGNQIDKRSSVDYLIDRTLLRPRDLIHFFNECLSVADGRSRLTVQLIKQAERDYSTKRLRSLCDEWRSVYPNLVDYCSVLESGNRTFGLADIDEDRFERFVVKSIEKGDRQHGPMHAETSAYMEHEGASSENVALKLMYHLYIVGLVGVKMDARSPVQWSYNAAVPLSTGSFKADCAFHVHPTFWYALGMG